MSKEKQRCGANVEKVIIDEFVPSKELEALEIECGELVEMDLLFLDRNGENQEKWHNSEAFNKAVEFEKKYGKSHTYILKQALQRLEFIDNANPSEALELLKETKRRYFNLEGGHTQQYIDHWKNLVKTLDIVENALLKAQEQGKVNAYVEKIKTMMKQKDCILTYVASEECFAVKTMLSGWYKLTPEFVESNVREEIKPLPLIEKNRKLKEENAELKRVLSVIKEKSDLSALEMANDVNEFNEMTFHKKPYTQEEFDLLKRYFGNEHTPSK